VAGLNRSNFRASASGAKLIPPWANPVSKEIIMPAIRIGTIHRITSTALQNSIGPLFSISPEDAA